MRAAMSFYQRSLVTRKSIGLFVIHLTLAVVQIYMVHQSFVPRLDDWFVLHGLTKRGITWLMLTTVEKVMDNGDLKAGNDEDEGQNHQARGNIEKKSLKYGW